MKIFRLLCAGMFLLVSLAFAGSSYAQDTKTKKTDKAQNTVNNIKQADPPKASNTPKRNPAGDKKSDYQPKQKPLKIKEPPAPSK